MLYIDKDSKAPLEKEFHKIHNICVIIYDQLTEIFSEEDYKDLSRTEFKIDEKNHIQIEKFQQGNMHALEWLKVNKMNEKITQVLTKHITMSVLSDFINFIYESLSCAMRGKTTVAYALLRKPFTDELLIFEQLLNDQNEFIERFYHKGDPSDYDPSDRKIDKEQIIKSVLNKAQPNMVFTQDLIYDMRYGKELGKGINGMSNHALHIVTNDKRYKTPDQNLNFVFSNKEDVLEYWERYYFIVPYLIIYSASIVDNLIFDYLPEEENKHLKNLKAFVRTIGILLWNEEVNKSSSEKIFQVFSNALKLECYKCNKTIELDRADFELFFEIRAVLCPKCLENNKDSPEFIEKLNELMILLTKSK